jgi:hypothetical protein
MFLSDAPMPPCAATVCERVGNLRQNRDRQPGFGELQRRAHPRAPGDETIASNLRTGKLIAVRRQSRLP